MYGVPCPVEPGAKGTLDVGVDGAATPGGKLGSVPVLGVVPVPMAGNAPDADGIDG